MEIIIQLELLHWESAKMLRECAVRSNCFQRAFLINRYFRRPVLTITIIVLSDAPEGGVPQYGSRDEPRRSASLTRSGIQKDTRMGYWYGGEFLLYWAFSVQSVQCRNFLLVESSNNLSFGQTKRSFEKRIRARSARRLCEREALEGVRSPRSGVKYGLSEREALEGVRSPRSGVKYGLKLSAKRLPTSKTFVKQHKRHYRSSSRSILATILTIRNERSNLTTLQNSGRLKTLSIKLSLDTNDQKWTIELGSLAKLGST